MVAALTVEAFCGFVDSAVGAQARLRKGDGSIDYFVGVIHDISTRKQAEKELRESEERFRHSLLHSPLPVSLFDDREQILAISQSWLEQSGI